MAKINLNLARLNKARLNTVDLNKVEVDERKPGKIEPDRKELFYDTTTGKMFNSSKEGLNKAKETIENMFEVDPASWTTELEYRCIQAALKRRFLKDLDDTSASVRKATIEQCLKAVGFSDEGAKNVADAMGDYISHRF